MTTLPARFVALVLFALGALLTAAPADEPKELTGDAKKLVGKWKATGEGVVEVFGDNLYMLVDFKGDGTGRMDLEITDAELKKLLGDNGMSMPFKWKVSGDKLEMSDYKAIDPKAPPTKKDKGKRSATLKFDGNDKVTLTPLDEKVAKTLTLTRSK